MLRFSVITLFPELITQYCQTSILGRAQVANAIEVRCVNPRDFSDDPWHKVDDSPYGGGPGMVMTCDPIIRAYESLLPLAPASKVFIMSPVAPLMTQANACDWAGEADEIVLICGHYEGIDERVKQLIPNCQPLCTGNMVLTGGELPAMTVIDAVARHVPGVLGKDDSASEESFMGNLLEYPHYTRPQTYRGLDVPEVLLSGNHQKIAQWRQQQRLENTKTYRPDLLSS